MNCRSCRKERNEPLSWTDRFKAWVLKHLSDEITDTKAESFTQGFSQGYEKGRADGIKRVEDNYHLQRAMLERDSIPMECQVELRDVLDARKDTQSVWRLYIGGKEVADNELVELKSQATYFVNTRLWRIMQESVKQKAIEKAVLQSKNWEETLAGKMLLHDVGLRNAMMDAILKAEARNPASVPTQSN